LRRLTAPFTIVLALGAGCWLVGNLAWLASAMLTPAVPWWLAFLVLTIAGERLELSRVLRLSPRVINLFILSAAVFLVGVALTLVAYTEGTQLAGLGLLLLAVWLLRYDLARHNIRRRGLTRFIAVCLFGGYIWLAAGGALWLVAGGAVAGPLYDAMLHVLFLGFVFAMIFGHAPLIFPSVLGRPMAYLPAVYAPLVVLHGSLALRVAGDLLGQMAARRWGGLLNGVALLLFLATTIAALAIGARKE